MKTLCLLLLLLTLPATAAPDLEAGRKLLAHYGWTCGSNTVEMSYTVPASLSGTPDSLYQRASSRVDLDLTPALGQEVTLVRFTLNRRSSDSNSPLYAHLAYYKSRIIGAWLSTDAVAPGIAALDDRNFGLGF